MDPAKAFVALIVLALGSFGGGVLAGGVALATDVLVEEAVENIGLVSVGLAAFFLAIVVVISVKDSIDELLSIHTISAFISWIAFSIGMITVGASPI